MSVPRIFNGQAWEQKDFPYFTFMVLMLGPEDGKIKFCKVSANTKVPMLMCKEDGVWKYSEEELWETIQKYKYTEVGRCQVVIEEESHDIERIY